MDNSNISNIIFLRSKRNYKNTIKILYTAYLLPIIFSLLGLMGIVSLDGSERSFFINLMNNNNTFYFYVVISLIATTIGFVALFLYGIFSYKKAKTSFNILIIKTTFIPVLLFIYYIYLIIT